MPRYDLEPFDLDNATRIEGGKRIYGGGGGSSSSASTTSTTTQNTDKRQVVDNGGFGVTTDNSTVNISQSDQGAIKAAGALASQALSSNAGNFNTLMDTVKLISQASVDTLKANTTLAQNLTASTQSAYADAASQAQGNKNLIYAGLAVVAMVGLNLVKKKAG